LANLIKEKSITLYYMGNLKINPAIFRAYDVRGIVGVDIDPDRMNLFGKAYAEYFRSLGVESVVLGYDNRETSPSLAKSLADGLMDSGISVTGIGEITTPCILFACRHLGIRAGLVVSASHNPAKYNGIKLVLDGQDRGGKAIETVRDLAISGKFSAPEKRGGYSEKNIFEEYLEALSKGMALGRKMKIAIDCGNGVVGPYATKYFRKIGCEVIEVNCESDSSYPNHPPDTVKPEYYPQLIRAVRENSCDLGLMFDGDGDRMAGVDEKGEILWADKFLMLFSREFLKTRKGGKVIVEIKCSQAVLDDVRNHGGIPILWQTGRTKIEDKMFEEGAILGGEMSGHMFFRLPDGTNWLSEALYAGGLACQIVSKSGKTISELLSDIPKYHSTQEYRPHYSGKPEEKKFALMEEIVSDFKAEWGERVLDIDGARIDFGYGWALVRVSNGEPVFSMRFEGKTEGDLERIVSLFRERMKKYPEIEFDFLE